MSIALPDLLAVDDPLVTIAHGPGGKGHHILEVFVHEDESDDPAVLASVFKNRSRDHAVNAYRMLYEPEKLIARAGQGVRQGFDDAGPLEN